MGLKDLSLKKAYSSDFDDIVHDFYIPALAEAIEYDRIAGFFSSSSLAVSARGKSRYNFVINLRRLKVGYWIVRDKPLFLEPAKECVQHSIIVI